MKFFLLVFALSIPFWLAGAGPDFSSYRVSRWLAHVRLPGDGGSDFCL